MTNAELESQSELELGAQTSSAVAWLVSELDSLRLAVLAWQSHSHYVSYMELAPRVEPIVPPDGLEPSFAAGLSVDALHPVIELVLPDFTVGVMTWP